MRKKRKLHTKTPNNNHMSRARKRRKIKVKRRFYFILILLSLLIFTSCRNIGSDKKNIDENNNYSISTPETVNLKNETSQVQIQSIDFNYNETKTQTIISITIKNMGQSDILNKTWIAVIKDIYGNELDRIELTVNSLKKGEKNVVNIVSNKYLITIANVEFTDF